MARWGVPGDLEIVAYPGTEEWVLRPEDADRVARWLDMDVQLEYWPRERVAEAWARDKAAAAPDQAEEVEAAGLNFRGYSFATQTRGNVAVIFVDYLEDYESATFVVLHELAHLHLPPWAPPLDRSEIEIDEEEDRADAVAGTLMDALLDYDPGIREIVQIRTANPKLHIPCSPRAVLRHVHRAVR